MKAKQKIERKSGTAGTKAKETMAGKAKRASAKPTLIENPLLDIQMTGDLEQDCRSEASAMKAALRESDRRYYEQRALTTDTEYFACIVFESREQKEIFLREMGWMLHGDKYIDGTALARKYNIKLPKVAFPAENVRGGFSELVDDDLN
jgi:hypothetical protein